MNLAEKYQVEIGGVAGSEFTEDAAALYVTAGTYVRLRVDKPTTIQEKLKVQVSWTAIGMVSPEEAAAFAEQVVAISALAKKIQEGGLL